MNRYLVLIWPSNNLETEFFQRKKKNEYFISKAGFFGLFLLKLYMVSHRITYCEKGYDQSLRVEDCSCAKGGVPFF